MPVPEPVLTVVQRLQDDADNLVAVTADADSKKQAAVTAVADAETATTAVTEAKAQLAKTKEQLHALIDQVYVV